MYCKSPQCNTLILFKYFRGKCETTVWNMSNTRIVYGIAQNLIKLKLYIKAAETEEYNYS